MLALTTDQQNALLARSVVRRIFIYVEALDDLGYPDPIGFWDDVGIVTINSRTYYGGNLASISVMNARSDLAVPSLSFVISGVAPEAALLIRGSNVGQKPMSLSLGIYNPTTRAIIGGLIPRFSGVVDSVDIVTPSRGGPSNITVNCESVSRSLTLQRTETRSPASVVERDPSDKIYEYTALQREITLYFGRPNPPKTGGGGSGAWKPPGGGGGSF